jgi:hypothetical protein
LYCAIAHFAEFRRPRNATPLSLHLLFFRRRIIIDKAINRAAGHV